MGLFGKTSEQKTIESTLVYDPKGLNKIGGTPPPELTIPALESSPVIYFGQIDKNEPALESIDFDFNLICPIFLSLYYPVFFDYSDPLSPKLITENVNTDFSQYFTDIPGSALIEYEEKRFSFDQSKLVNLEMPYPGEIGHSGQPVWIQNEDWPNCPVTGNRMQFLFQLRDIDNCKTRLGQDILDKEYIDPYLHFGYGDLYVFFDPESRVVGYLNQIT